MATPKKKLKDVVIDRAKWFRGALYNENAALLVNSPGNPAHGTMCCLGFAARACGIPKKEICNKPAPSNLFCKIPASFSGLLDGPNSDGVVGSELMRANDLEKLTGKVREARIKSLGKQAGFNFTFTGKTPRLKKAAK